MTRPPFYAWAARNSANSARPVSRARRWLLALTSPLVSLAPLLILASAIALELWAAAGRNSAQRVARGLAASILLSAVILVAALVTKLHRPPQTAYGFLLFVTPVIVFAGQWVARAGWVEPLSVLGVLLLAAVNVVGALVGLPVVFVLLVLLPLHRGT